MIETGDLPPTILLYGPEGVGKTTFAYRFARALLGRDDHPDFYEIEPEGKWHSMATLKELIHESALPPFEASCRLFLIHEAHRMLPAHSNALLKTLEEPSEQTHFILITHDINAILPTIRSRAIEIPFFPIPSSDIASYLDCENADQLALLAEGSLGRAVRLQKELPYDDVLNLIKAGLSSKHALFFRAADALEKEHTLSFTLVRDILTLIAYFYRDIHLIKRNCAAKDLIFKNETPSLKALSALPLPPLESTEELLAGCLEAYQLNFKLRHILERAILQPI